MSLLLRNLFRLHRLMDEAGETGDAGGGGSTGGELNIDIGGASDAIGADLGLNEGGGTDDFLSGSATPPGEKPSAEDKTGSAADPAAKAAAEARTKAAAATEKATRVAAAKANLTAKQTDFTGKTDDEILAMSAPATKNLPKAWKAEQKAIWDKLPPEAQAYIEQREAEVEAGFKAHGEVGRYAKEIQDVVGPYQPLLTAQGIKNHGEAVKFLLNAHYMLSTKDDQGRAEFYASLAKSYKVDLAKVALVAQTHGVQETPAERSNRERLEKLENDRNSDVRGRYEALKADADREINAFAADPANPYFSEVQQEIALLLQDPKMTLKDAYERAVYANPVTRAKELARLNTEAEAKAKKDADEKAAAAEKARGTRIRGTEKERASPDLLGTMEDTMRETYKKIHT